MTRRLVAVVAPPSGPEMPGVARETLRAAMVEDVCDLVAGLPLVEPALVIGPGDAGLAGLVAPGTPVLDVPDAGDTVGVVGALTDLGADEVVLIAGDAPDLPALLVGKIFRGLATADVAVIPAAGGGLVALGLRLPAAAWYDPTDGGLDTEDAVHGLRAASPSRRALSVAPGWHRMRTAADLTTLDPDLEGWDATRTLLA